MRRAHLTLVLALAACTTVAAADAVPADLRGCWIERRGEDTLTMRWFPGEGSSWRGDLLHYAPGVDPEPQTYLIEKTIGLDDAAAGWALCPQAEPTNPPCRTLSFGPGDEEYRAEIRVTSERLSMIWVESGEQLRLFDGQRDGCD